MVTPSVSFNVWRRRCCSMGILTLISLNRRLMAFVPATRAGHLFAWGGLNPSQTPKGGDGEGRQAGMHALDAGPGLAGRGGGTGIFTQGGPCSGDVSLARLRRRA